MKMLPIFSLALLSPSTPFRSSPPPEAKTKTLHRSLATYPTLISIRFSFSPFTMIPSTTIHRSLVASTLFRRGTPFSSPNPKHKHFIMLVPLPCLAVRLDPHLHAMCLMNCLRGGLGSCLCLCFFGALEWKKGNCGWGCEGLEWDDMEVHSVNIGLWLQSAREERADLAGLPPVNTLFGKSLLLLNWYVSIYQIHF